MDESRFREEVIKMANRVVDMREAGGRPDGVYEAGIGVNFADRGLEYIRVEIRIANLGINERMELDKLRRRWRE